MEDKEEIYESEIKPFVQQIYDKCKERGIPFIASFQTKEGELRGTCSIPTEANDRLHVAYAILNNEVAFSVIDQVLEGPMKAHD